MNNLLIGILGVALSTNQPAAFSNFLAEATSVRVSVPDPAEQELKKIMEDDDAAADEVDGWIKENQKFAAVGAPIPAEELNRRILKRFEPVREAYEDFLKRHPDNADGHVAYASFLGDLGEHDLEYEHLETARKLDPSDPAIWNNLANHYGHDGEVKKAFEYYAKAIEIDPTEPIYYQNFATTVYLFRQDAMEFYQINEQQVFDKALKLYADALKLTPTDFALATDLAQSYYGIRPLRTNDALQSWTNALKIAQTEIEREGVHTHLARMETMFGHFDEARAHLDAVTNEIYSELKARLVKSLIRHEEQAGQTNALPSVDATNDSPVNP